MDQSEVPPGSSPGSLLLCERGRLRKELFLRKISGAGQWTDLEGGRRGKEMVLFLGGGASGHFRHDAVLKF